MPSMKFQMFTSTRAMQNAAIASDDVAALRMTPSARTIAATSMHRQPRPGRQRPVIVDPADPRHQHQADRGGAEKRTWHGGANDQPTDAGQQSR